MNWRCCGVKALKGSQRKQQWPLIVLWAVLVETVVNRKSSELDTLAIGSSATGRVLVYALEPIGLDNGYVVIQCTTSHISLYDRGFPSC